MSVGCDFCVESGSLLWTLLFLFSCAASGGWQEPENPHTQRVSEREGCAWAELHQPERTVRVSGPLNHFFCIYIILQIPVPVPNLHLDWIQWREGLLEAPLRISQYKISFWEEAQLKPSYLMVLLKHHRWMCCVCMWKKAVFQSRVCLGSGKHNCTFNTLPFYPLGLHSKRDQPRGGGRRC